MNNGQKMIDEMRSGNVSAILECLNREVLFKIDAIICSVQHNIVEENVVNKISSMKNDDEYLRSVAFTVGEFSSAALHLLGIEEYTGENKSIIRLIESKFDF